MLNACELCSKIELIKAEEERERLAKLEEEKRLAEKREKEILIRTIDFIENTLASYVNNAKSTIIIVPIDMCRSGLVKFDCWKRKTTRAGYWKRNRESLITELNMNYIYNYFNTYGYKIDLIDGCRYLTAEYENARFNGYTTTKYLQISVNCPIA